MDENSKLGGDGGAPKSAPENAVVENPNSATNTGNLDAPGGASVAAAELHASHPSRQPSSRTPFTNLSQVDADLALARTLQEQERAYMMLTMNGGGSSYGSWEGDHYFDDDDDDDYDDPDGHEYDGVDVEDVEDDSEDDENDEGHDHDDDDGEDDEENDASSDFPDDEAYARALQDAEEREMAARLLAMAGITESEDLEDHGAGVNPQDVWEEVDPDELSYEELIALGDVVGTESRGLSADTIASLPSVNYKSEDNKDGEPGTCVVCRLDYEDGDTLTVLNCKHSYHSECINNWLNINKVCPICSTEVSTSGNS